MQTEKRIVKILTLFSETFLEIEATFLTILLVFILIIIPLLLLLLAFYYILYVGQCVYTLCTFIVKHFGAALPSVNV